MWLTSMRARCVFKKRSDAPYARIVSRPTRVSDKDEKMGERETLSRRFKSCWMLANCRSRRKNAPPMGTTTTTM